jgi:hypothetical protein
MSSRSLGTEGTSCHCFIVAACSHRPVLSICVYHKQNDLWRIPLFIHTLVEDYCLFLRPRDGDGWDLVCYGVPANRLMGAP